jgi:DtxR family Mn-dependent transcriptional regulator
MTTAATEDYLKAIYQIQQEHGRGPVNTTALAARLGVAGASVTGMLKKLAAGDPSLVVYEQALGYSWDEVHAEAERLEHVISEELEERIAAHLGHPHIDPHGDPIPDREGNLIILETLPLTELNPGQVATIQRVSSHNPDLLRYLDSLGLTIHARLEVIDKGPFSGPLLIRLAGPAPSSVTGQAGPPSESVHALSREVTDQVFVILESIP